MINPGKQMEGWRVEQKGEGEGGRKANLFPICSPYEGQKPNFAVFESGRPDLNRRQPRWQRGALPLSYARLNGTILLYYRLNSNSPRSIGSFLCEVVFHPAGCNPNEGSIFPVQSRNRGQSVFPLNSLSTGRRSENSSRSGVWIHS